MRRRTLSRVVTRSGVGVHTGAAGRVRLHPAPFGHGIVFVGLGRQYPVGVAFASGAGNTCLGPVQTVEHLLAALVSTGVTDVRVEVVGPEVPILDGSARPWLEGLEEAGVVEGPRAPVYGVVRPAEVLNGDGRVRFSPGDRLEIAVNVVFPDGEAPSGRLDLALDAHTFEERLAGARTFVRERDVARLKDAGRGRGASPANTVLVAANAPPEVVDGAIAHKALDLVGDLALLGAPLLGRVEVDRPCHSLHRRALGLALARGIVRAVTP